MQFHLAFPLWISFGLFSSPQTHQSLPSNVLFRLLFACSLSLGRISPTNPTHYSPKQRVPSKRGEMKWPFSVHSFGMWMSDEKSSLNLYTHELNTDINSTEEDGRDTWTGYGMKWMMTIFRKFSTRPPYVVFHRVIHPCAAAAHELRTNGISHWHNDGTELFRATEQDRIGSDQWQLCRNPLGKPFLTFATTTLLLLLLTARPDQLMRCDDSELVIRFGSRSRWMKFHSQQQRTILLWASPFSGRVTRE